MSEIEEPQFNTHPDFVGCGGLKTRLYRQVRDFRANAQSGDWDRIRRDHYDWWTFPLPKTNSATGSQYAVFPGDIARLQADPEYLALLTEALTLVVASWGWDLAARVLHTDAETYWDGWTIRLHKMAECSRRFGLTDAHASLQEFAADLRQRYPQDFFWPERGGGKRDLYDAELQPEPAP